MDIEEVKEQTKNWLDSRLKNPYFGAVIAVWIISNRILIFSLFNFDSDYDLNERILFIHSELQKFDKLDFLWGLRGIWATIIWAFTWGFVVMLVVDQFNGLGKVLFKLGNRTTNYLLRKVEPLNWIELKIYNDLKKEKEDFEEEVNNRKIEIKRLQKENDDTITLLNKSESSNIEKDKALVATNEKSKLFEDQVKIFTEEKNRFKIIYACYGNTETVVEVTKIVSDLISSQVKFKVNNETIKFDPARFSVKQLYIEYEVNSE